MNLGQIYDEGCHDLYQSPEKYVYFSMLKDPSGIYCIVG